MIQFGVVDVFSYVSFWSGQGMKTKGKSVELQQMGTWVTRYMTWIMYLHVGMILVAVIMLKGHGCKCQKMWYAVTFWVDSIIANNLPISMCTPRSLSYRAWWEIVLQIVSSMEDMIILTVDTMEPMMACPTPISLHWIFCWSWPQTPTLVPSRGKLPHSFPPEGCFPSSPSLWGWAKTAKVQNVMAGWITVPVVSLVLEALTVRPGHFLNNLLRKRLCPTEICLPFNRIEVLNVK